jgi:hypothetical protein
VEERLRIGFTRRVRPLRLGYRVNPRRAEDLFRGYRDRDCSVGRGSCSRSFQSFGDDRLGGTWTLSGGRGRVELSVPILTRSPATS